MSRYRRNPSYRRYRPNGIVLPLNIVAQIQAVNVLNPGTPGASTSVTLLCLGSGNRIDQTADPARLSGIFLLCRDASGTRAVQCVALNDGGPSVGGRTAELVFPVDPYLELGWSLRFPGNSGLIKSPRGGPLGGIIGPDGEITGNAQGGLFFGPDDGGAPFLPQPLIITSVQPSGGTEYSSQLYATSGLYGLAPFSGPLHVLLNGSVSQLNVLQTSGSSFIFEPMGGSLSPGDAIVVPGWSPSIRDASGAVLSLCQVVVS